MAASQPAASAPNRATLPSGAPPAPITTEQIQKLLEENKTLINIILEHQSQGRLQECAQYQQRLQHNLMYLAALADAQHPQKTQNTGGGQAASPVPAMSPQAQPSQAAMPLPLNQQQQVDAGSQQPSLQQQGGAAQQQQQQPHPQGAAVWQQQHQPHLQGGVVQQQQQQPNPQQQQQQQQPHLQGGVVQQQQQQPNPQQQPYPQGGAVQQPQQQPHLQGGGVQQQTCLQQPATLGPQQLQSVPVTMSSLPLATSVPDA